MPHADDERPFPRLVRYELARQLTDDADANARKIRHDVRDRLQVLSCVAGELRDSATRGHGATIAQLQDWAETVQRQIDAVAELAAVVQKLPKQPAPPAPPAAG